MLKLAIIFITLFLICGAAKAQEPPKWCDAPWPPQIGKDRTIGKTDTGAVCYKMLDTPIIRVFYAVGSQGYQEDYKADETVIDAGWMVFKNHGVEVGRQKLANITGWQWFRF